MALLIWHWIVKSESYKRSNIQLLCDAQDGWHCIYSQSLISVVLLRGFFPEWNAEFTLLDFTVLALVIMVFQLCFAYGFLAVFKQGPAESVWRRLVNAETFYEPT